MITTGAKFFFGVAIFGLVAAIAYALGSENELAGTITLAGLGVVAGALGGVTTAFRDGEVATAAFPDGVAESPATIGRGPIVSPAPWPILGALGAALLLVGLAFEFWMVVAGIVVLLAVIVEWMVQSWADRASDDAEYNRSLRNRMMHPLEFPILGTLAVGLVIFGFSRVMLTLTKEAAVVVFIAVAALVLVVAALFAGARRIRGEVILATLAVGGIIVLTAGVISAVRGSRGFEAHEGEGADTETVADAANIVARVEVTDAGMRPEEISLARAQPASITFTNTTGTPLKLVVEAGDVLDSSGQPTGDKALYETGFVEDGQTAFVTFQINLPGTYHFFAETADGAQAHEGTITVS